jgi:hypothetical protein
MALGILCGHLVYFPPVLVCVPGINLATLSSTEPRPQLHYFDESMHALVPILNYIYYKGADVRIVNFIIEKR